jgi:hypothetical protein
MILVRSIPLYWGIETEPSDRTLVTRSDLYEVLPPFRESIWAFRVRVSHRHWLHVGIFRYDRDRVLQVPASASEIRKWGQDARVQEESVNGDDTIDEVRPVDF